MYKPPAFIFELCGQFNVPVGNARGNYVSDFFQYKNYGLVYGVGFHFIVKYAANKKGTLYPYLSFGFVQLQNDDPNNAFIDSNIINNGYPLQGNQTYQSKPGNSLLAIRDIHLGLGLLYYFSSTKSVLPFGGFEIDYNNIWGYYEQVLGFDNSNKTIFNINRASRVGIGIDAGMDYRISQNLGFVFGAKFKVANLFGKASDKTNPTEKYSINLLDKTAPDLNSNLSSSRNITYFQLYLGFSVFAGKK
jgi:hypothetical protein